VETVLSWVDVDSSVSAALRVSGRGFGPVSSSRPGLATQPREHFTGQTGDPRGPSAIDAIDHMIQNLIASWQVVEADVVLMSANVSDHLNRQQELTGVQVGFLEADDAVMERYPRGLTRLTLDLPWHAALIEEGFDSRPNSSGAGTSIHPIEAK
jgi:hypothetical protein